MGKFYNHYLFFCQEHQRQKGECYVVPYCKLTAGIKDGTLDYDSFKQKWLECLKTTTEDFDARLQSLWKVILVEAQTEPDLLGAMPEDALEYYVESCGEECVTSLLTRFQDLQNLAWINAESLGHSIRKFDKKMLQKEKGNDKEIIFATSSLLPKLISSSFMMATSSLVSIVSFLHRNLEMEEDIIEDLQRNSVLSNDNFSSRAEELQWFNQNVTKLDHVDKYSLVGHRGFHHVNDRSDNRPLENTLASFEQTWAAGISICECDVALTKDGKIVLAHDENFARLALCSDCGLSVERVSDLTLREIFSLPLKGGTRPPLLSDVLRSAAAIGEHSKLVIEIKPGNSEICVPLISLFARNPGLLNYVAVIMSFDSYIMKELSLQMDDLAQILNLNHGPEDLGCSIMYDKTQFPPGNRGNGTKGLGASMMFNKSQFPKRGSIIGGARRSCLIHQPFSPTDSYKPNNSLLMSMMNIDTTVDAQIKIPKLILVTAASSHGAAFITNVCDSFSVVDKWMSDCGLDGIYLEFESEMFEPHGIEAMKCLASTYDVGIWMDAKKHPDKLSICRDLVSKCNVSYVNTDFPPDFFDS